MSDGELPEGIVDKQRARAIALGLYATNIPRRARRPGLHLPPAGAGPGAGRTRHERARLEHGHSALLVGRRRHRAPARTLAAADRPRGDAGVLRDHGGVRRLGRVRPDGHGPPGRRRLHPRRREVARHVVQRGGLRVLPGGAHDGAARRRARTVRRRHDAPGVRVVRTPAYSHTISHHHPIVAFEGVRVPASTSSATRGTG